MLHLFVNPVSGRGQGRRVLELWREYDAVEIQPARLREQLRERVRPGDVVGVAGGDGTVSMVVDALLDLSLAAGVRVAVCPLGTGNDLARALGVPETPSPLAFVGRLLSGGGRVRSIPVWRWGARRFLNYLSLGLDARMLATADTWRRLLPGSLSFRQFTLGLAGLRHMGWLVPGDTALRTPERRISLRGLGGAILSSLGWYLGGARIGELAPAEPRLSLTVIRGAEDYARLALGRFRHGGPALPFQGVTEVRIEGPAVPVQIDGEVAGFAPGAVTCEGTVAFLA